MHQELAAEETLVQLISVNIFRIEKLNLFLLKAIRLNASPISDSFNFQYTVSDRFHLAI